MSLILGIGDEVTWFAVATLIIILILSVSFLWQSLTIQHASHRQEPNSSSPAEGLHEEISPSVNQENQSSCDVVNSDRSNTSAPCANDAIDDSIENIDRIEEINSCEGEDSEIVVVGNCCEKDKADCSNDGMSSLSDPPRERNLPLSDGPKVMRRTLESSSRCDVASTSHQVGNESGTSHSVPTVSETEQLHSDQIVVRIKYLNDMERTASTRLSKTIADFKRDHFAEELAANKRVRLIFNGQLLQNSITLQHCGISDGCVIHVHISQSDPQQSPTTADSNVDLDLSHVLWPLLSIILVFLWILYFKYPQFFNVTSTGILLIFTGGFIVVYGYGENRVQVHN